MAASEREVTAIVDTAEDEVVLLASSGPINPGAIALIHLRMLRAIAARHGTRPDDTFLANLVDSLSQGLSARTLTEKMARWVPVVGRLVDALAATRITHELGWAAHEHFGAMDAETLKRLVAPPPPKRKPISPDSVPPAMLPDGSPNPMLVSGHHGPTWVGLDELQKRIQANPQDDDLVALLGFIYYTSGKYEKAIEHYKRAIALNDASATHHYYLGNAYFRAGQFVPAAQEWERVVKLEPEGRLGTNARRRAASVKKIKV